MSFITEKEAAALMGYTPRELRRRVVNGFINCEYRFLKAKTYKKNYQYKKSDLEKLFINVKKIA